MKRVVERRVGLGLDELDEYLHDYKFGPDTLMAIVGYYLEEGQPDPSFFEEIARDVDRFLWTYAEAGSIIPETFVGLVQVFLLICTMISRNCVAGAHSGGVSEFVLKRV